MHRLMCLQMMRAPLATSVRCQVQVRAFAAPTARRTVVDVQAAGMRLGTLAPAPGSKKDKTRKGRGYGGHQVRAGSSKQAMGVGWLGGCSQH